MPSPTTPPAAPSPRPAKASPRTPAPGLPLSRRPAPRRLLAVIALAVILIAAAAPAVSAETITGSIYEPITEVIEGSPGKWYDYYNGYKSPNSWRLTTDFKNKVIVSSFVIYEARVKESPTVYAGTENYFSASGYLGNIEIATAIIEFQKLRYNTTSGEGIYTVVMNLDWNQTWVDTQTGSASHVSFGGFPTTKAIYFTLHDSSIPEAPSYVNAIGSADRPSSPRPIVYNIERPTFEQIYEISTDHYGIIIDITRVIDGRKNPSKIIIQNLTTGETTYESETYIDIDGLYYFPGTEYIVSLESQYNQGKFYEIYRGTEGIPTPTPTQQVTVTVQSLQTGNLIANPHLIISAATGDPPTLTEAVNATLPGGTGTYELEKADYLKYHATATAPGYTLLSPILFGVPEGGTTIALWMAPDAPPDDPIEEGKSMLYGYIQTQGSQQPISGATVSLNGYGSTTTSSTGFYLFNNVTPGSYSISASAPLHDALSEPVTVETVATPYNLALRGHFLLTVTAKDDTSLTNLHNATISLSDGQESTQNPATFTADYGPYIVTAAAEGYYPQAQSVYLNNPGTTTATVLLTERPPPAEMPNYPQHNVRFLCVDEYNHPLQNVTITAVYQESSGPVSWITDWLGLSQNVHVANSTLQGTTGLDGSVIFLMVQSVQYRMTVAAPDLNMTKTFDLYPKEDQITIRFVTSPGPDLSTMPTYDLTATETDPSSVRLALTYNDTTNATTSLTFNVYDHATGDVIHTQTFGASSFPGTVSPTYTVENTKGAMYRFGFEATNTAHGTISQYKGITLKGDNLLVDLGFEDRTLYNWLAVILLLLFAGAFSGTNVKQGAILVPLFGGGLFWFIGWLPITIGGVISAIGFLGVLVYMRKSEWKVRA